MGERVDDGEQPDLPSPGERGAYEVRVLDKDEIPTYSVETFMQKVDMFLTGWERLIVEATQKPITRTELVIIQSDTPPFVLDPLGIYVSQLWAMERRGVEVLEMNSVPGRTACVPGLRIVPNKGLQDDAPQAACA